MMRNILQWTGAVVFVATLFVTFAAVQIAVFAIGLPLLLSMLFGVVP